MTIVARFAAVIVCGGQSRRMGRPKASLPFGPEVLLQRVVRLVAEGIGGGPIVVVAAVGQAMPELPSDVLVARDQVQGRGPLQGLAAGMEALPNSVELVYASAADVPFLNPRWIPRLAERIGDADIAMPYLEGHHHPLSAVYRRARVLPALHSLLAANRLRVLCLMEKLQTSVLQESDLCDIDPLFSTIKNLNTPEDYARALTDAGLA